MNPTKMKKKSFLLVAVLFVIAIVCFNGCTKKHSILVY